jgi:non-heme chloroperoxidase
MKLITMLRTVGAALALAIVQCSIAPASAETLYVEGEGGVPLAVTITGPEQGPEILFVHGLGMGTASFSPQMESSLSDYFRMVAFDLRGHGMSGKPWQTEAYAYPAIWAADMAKVMHAAKLKKPVIVGWSYGTLVAADYLREYGHENISGLVMVGALGGFIPFTPPAGGPDPELLAQLMKLQELRKSTSFDDQLAAVEIFLTMLTAAEAPPEWIDEARMLGMMVPGYAQAALRKHPSDNGDLVPLLGEMPTLILHGSEDPSVSPAALEAFVKAAPTIKSHAFEGAGHSPFAEQASAFNDELARFVIANWSDNPE